VGGQGVDCSRGQKIQVRRQITQKWEGTLFRKVPSRIITGRGGFSWVKEKLSLKEDALKAQGREAVRKRVGGITSKILCLKKHCSGCIVLVVKGGWSNKKKRSAEFPYTEKGSSTASSPEGLAKKRKGFSCQGARRGTDVELGLKKCRSSDKKKNDLVSSSRREE